RLIEQLSDTSEQPGSFDALLAAPRASTNLLRRQSQDLAQRARRLGELAEQVHAAGVVAQLAELAAVADDEIDLIRGALLIAALDNEELALESYCRELELMAGEIRGRIADEASDAERLAALNDYLFEENGFHGSRTEYYNRANSYLNQVID